LFSVFIELKCRSVTVGWRFVHASWFLRREACSAVLSRAVFLGISSRAGRYATTVRRAAAG
jgi:hypothetical protein